MVRALVIHLRKKVPKLDEKVKEEITRKVQKALKNYPGVQFKGTFIDENRVGICEWEASNTEAVEKIAKKLGVKYDKIVEVKQVLS